MARHAELRRRAAEEAVARAHQQDQPEGDEGGDQAGG